MPDPFGRESYTARRVALFIARLVVPVAAALAVERSLPIQGFFGEVIATMAGVVSLGVLYRRDQTARLTPPAAWSWLTGRPNFPLGLGVGYAALLMAVFIATGERSGKAALALAIFVGSLAATEGMALPPPRRRQRRKPPRMAFTESVPREFPPRERDLDPRDRFAHPPLQ
jgi:hypothetical protein